MEINTGRTSKTSPTIPRSAILNIGAFSSIFIATMYLDFDIPAKCCNEPLIPQAIYKVGVIVLPVCPTCSECGLHPLSTTALVAPTAPFYSSASSSINLKFSAFLKPNPPATTTSASVMLFLLTS